MAEIQFHLMRRSKYVTGGGRILKEKALAQREVQPGMPREINPEDQIEINRGLERVENPNHGGDRDGREQS